jgi:hypothetical protein
MNGNEVKVDNEMWVQGSSRGQNNSSGTAKATGLGEGLVWDSDLRPAWSVFARQFIIGDSGMVELAVAAARGDWVRFRVDFLPGGWLEYDIRVVDEGPVFYDISISGELTGETAMPPLPWERELRMRFHEDGTVTGYGISRGQLASGETYAVPGLISGSFKAAKPSVALPVMLSSRLAIESFDSASGRWIGQEDREALALDSQNSDTFLGSYALGDLLRVLQYSSGSGLEQSGPIGTGGAGSHGPQG